MAKKKKPAVEEKPVVVEPEVIEDQEEVTCPVCGKPVGIEVTSCPHCGAEFEPEEPVAAEAPQIDDSEDEMAACPVCHKMVSLSVASCPYCGAEFEAEEEEAVPAKAVPKAVEYVEPDETAECPVCGKMVALDVASCPSCGAEFEEEEVEEIIEVEEKPVAKAAPRMVPVEEPVEEFVEEEVEVEEEEPAYEVDGPTSIMDLRVIGMSLIVLGILGSQIAFMIDWYWTWVPPIEDNLGMFIAVPAVIIVVGLLAFLLVKRAVSGGKKVRKPIPGLTLSMFLTGILALVMVMLWNPINSALQDSNIMVGVVFVVMLAVGILAVIMGMRASARASAG
jgi:predicted amidophosphoribosyltransferase